MLQVMAALKQLASEGHTVVCSIHQPRSSIFARFDDLILLSEGACLYSGELAVIDADASLTYSVPARTATQQLLLACSAWWACCTEYWAGDTSPCSLGQAPLLGAGRTMICPKHGIWCLHDPSTCP